MPTMLRLRAGLSAALLIASALAGCGGGSSPTAPDPGQETAPLSLSLETASYVFHYSEGDGVDAERQEALHEWATAQLGVAPGRKVQYFKYRSLAHMGSLTGRIANGWADPEAFEVHSIFRWNAHEAIHVYSALIGRPSDFFNEGLAVAMATDPLAGIYVPRWNGISVHTWARQHASTLLPLESMVTTPDFRSLDDATSYPQAGSFVAYLIETHGIGAVASLFAAGTRDDSKGRILSDFQRSFGVSLEQAERDWRGFLGI